MSQLLPSGSQHILAASPVIINCIIAIRVVFKLEIQRPGSKHRSVAYHATVFKVMIGSVGDVLQGRDSAREVIRNWNGGSF